MMMSTAGYAIAAAAAALVATAIMHLLLIATPRPQMFFTWIIGLATVIAVVYPFSTTAPLSQQAATASQGSRYCLRMVLDKRRLMNETGNDFRCAQVRLWFSGLGSFGKRSIPAFLALCKRRKF